MGENENWQKNILKEPNLSHHRGPLSHRLKSRGSLSLKSFILRKYNVSVLHLVLIPL